MKNLSVYLFFFIALTVAGLAASADRAEKAELAAGGSPALATSSR